MIFQPDYYCAYDNLNLHLQDIKPASETKTVKFFFPLPFVRLEVIKELKRWGVEKIRDIELDDITYMFQSYPKTIIDVSSVSSWKFWYGQDGFYLKLTLNVY